MNLSDLIIIYLACGAPFGVYHFTKRGPSLANAKWLAVAGSFLFWPIFVFGFLVRHFISGNGTVQTAATAGRVEQIRNQIEAIAFFDSSMTSLFEFRDVYYRFISLLTAAVEKPPVRNELFEVSGHTNNKLASRCLARRNLERLTFHQTCVRNEFVDLIRALADGAQDPDEIITLAAALTQYLGDKDATAELKSLLSTTANANRPENLPVKEEALAAGSAGTVN
jgi:hypothetical protein